MKKNTLKSIDGSKSKTAEVAVKSLTHKDIKLFFAKFAEAIFVDQERVNEMPHEDCHPEYNDGMWQRNREDHVYAVVKLSMTIDAVPAQLLNRLTEFAVEFRPQLVRTPFLNAVSDLATGVGSPRLYETATLFFNQLIKDVSRQNSRLISSGDPQKNMMMWFSYDDPIEISKDPECQYFANLVEHIAQESKDKRRALCIRGRLEFIKQRVNHEFVEDMLPELRG